MNREFDVWMRDYHNRMKYGLDPNMQFVKRHKARVGLWLFWLSFLAMMIYWRTR